MEVDVRPERLLENYRLRKSVGLVPGAVGFPASSKRFMLQKYRPCDHIEQGEIDDGNSQKFELQV